MKAKRKPLDKKTPADFSVEEKRSVTTLKVEPPAQREAGIKVESVSELIEKLKTEAKVLS
jgi:electron transfer flavoprotein beta subunit